MSSEFDFVLCLFCENKTVYLQTLDYLYGHKCVESHLIEIEYDQPEIAEFLSREFPDFPDAQYKISTWIEKFLERFPPAYKHHQFFRSYFGDDDLADDKHCLDAKLIDDNYLATRLMLKNLNQINIPNEELWQYLEKVYKPTILELVGDFDFAPDDFEPFEEYLKGEYLPIWENSRTVAIKYPIFDITKSIRLKEILETSGYQFSDEMAQNKALHVLPIEFDHDDYLHYFTFLAYQAAKNIKGVQWLVIPLYCD